MEGALTRDDIQTLLGLPDSVMARVEAHRALLAEWNQRMNLVGPRELDRYWERHALDSLQLLQHAPGARRWLDIGSGAGFPGVLIGCALTETPGAEVVLVESIAKKAAFLRAAAEATGAPALVAHERFEASAVRTGTFDVVTARAFAPLPRIVEAVMPLLRGGALGLFPKGADAAQELAACADQGWRLRAELLPSLSDPRAAIVRIEGAAP